MKWLFLRYLQPALPPSSTRGEGERSSLVGEEKEERENKELNRSCLFHAPPHHHHPKLAHLPKDQFDLFMFMRRRFLVAVAIFVRSLIVGGWGVGGLDGSDRGEKREGEKKRREEKEGRMD